MVDSLTAVLEEALFVAVLGAADFLGSARPIIAGSSAAAFFVETDFAVLAEVLTVFEDVFSLAFEAVLLAVFLTGFLLLSITG